MKLKLFGSGAVEPLNLVLLNGGYDPEIGRIVLTVNNTDLSGMVTLDVTEARRVLALLQANIPDVKMVETLPTNQKASKREPE